MSNSKPSKGSHDNYGHSETQQGQQHGAGMTKRTLRASIFMRAVQTGISAALTGTPNQSSCAPAESMPFMDATCSVSLQACMKPRHSALLHSQGRECPAVSLYPRTV